MLGGSDPAPGGWHRVGPTARRMGDTGVVTSSAAAPSAPASGAPAAAATPEQVRRSWLWSAAQGVVLVVLAVVAVVVPDTGVRLLLGGLGVLGVVRGVALLRSARAGRVERSAAVTGAAAAWSGAVAIGLATFPPVVAAWTCVAVLTAVLVALVVRAEPARRVRVVLVVGLAVAVLAVGAVLAGPTWLTAASVLAVSVAVLAAGVMSVTAALALRRAAAQPAPVGAGCGGCACGAGGCGGLQRG